MEFRQGQEFVPGGDSGSGGGPVEFRPGQAFFPGGGFLTANAGEFVPPSRGADVRVPEFRPGQEFVPGGGRGGGLAANPNAGEFVPGGQQGLPDFVPEFVPGNMGGGGGGGGREFVPGQEFIPGGYSDEVSLMQAVPDDDGEGGFHDGDGDQYGEGDYADDGYGEDSEGWMALAAAAVGTGVPHPKNAVMYTAFDPGEELVWTGSASGRLASHLLDTDDDDDDEPDHGEEERQGLTSLRAVTQVRAFTTPIQQIIPINDGVLALGKSALRIYTRGGIPLATLKAAEDAGGLVCMDVVAQANAVVCGGTNPVLTSMDLISGTVTRGFEHGRPGLSCVKSAGRYVTCASLDGHVSLHDPRSLGMVHTLSAHAGPVTSLDIREHQLVTCGMNVFRGQAAAEPTIKVFDLRRQPRPLAQIPFFPAPVLIKYNPKFSSTLCCATSVGALQMCDVGGLFAMPDAYQVAESVTAMDVSATGELVVFGDEVGGLYVWADAAAMSSNARSGMGEKVTVNQPGTSMQTSLPSRRPPLCEGGRWGEDTPLSNAPMPQAYASSLLSDWPPMVVGKTSVPQVIDESVLKAMKTTDMVGYLPNPGFKRGQTHKGLAWLRKVQSGEHGSDDEGGEDKKADVEGKRKKWKHIVSHYQLQEIKLGKLGIEDFDFGKYNGTNVGGLENMIPNSYVNAWIHTMLFIWPLRSRVLSYLSAKEVSLTDELGFIFHMLLSSRGQCCQATNFLRAFSQLPEASRLELLDKETATAFVPREGSDRELLRRVQNLNRFVLEQMHKEMTGKEGSATSAIDLVFGADMMRTQMVLGVGGGGAAKEPVKDPAAQQQSREFQWRLVYAKADSAGSAVKTEPAAIKADGAGAEEAASEAAAATPPTFAQVLQGALCSEQTTRAWHEASKSYKPTKVRRAMTSAPNVLCIDRFRHLCRNVCEACGVVSWAALAAAPREHCSDSDRGIELPHTDA